MLDSANQSIISGVIHHLRQLTQRDVQSDWQICTRDCDITALPAQSFETGELNEKGYLVWEKGRKVRWFYQEFRLPEDVQGYPVDGLTLRLALTWWAEVAQVFVNDEKVQEGDLFDHSCRVVLSQQVVPGEVVRVGIRLVSPGHDIGGLMKSRLMYESDYDDIDPGFVADELAVLQSYLETFAPEELATVEAQVGQFDWLDVSDRSKLHGALQKLRDRLHSFSPRLKQHTVFMVGHAHLDMAWLWDVEETWKAAERTFNSVLNLQNDFPDLTFCHSTPALYQWIEQNRPELFAQIKERVEDGRWEVIGGLWVEPEMNLISGEAIARHILYGQRYYQEKFGDINRIAWLPDTFGFNWQLPQLLKQGGMDYFVTQKFRWNDTNKYPYEMFQWQAPDGSTVFSLMSSPIGEGIDPIALSTYAWEWFTRTGSTDCLWLPGVGDHGGGPTRDMLTIAKRWEKSPFFPTLKFITALKYLESLENRSAESLNSKGGLSHLEHSSTHLEHSVMNDQHSSAMLLDSTTNDQPSTAKLEHSTTKLKHSAVKLEGSTTKPGASTTNDQHSAAKLEGSTTKLKHSAAKLEGSTTKLGGSTTNDQPSSEMDQELNPIPLWNDELYLEFHRGCYTTHGDQKRFNRDCEALLYQAELFASLATLSTQAPYPKDALEAAWKKVLFNQFHDILPGSSITQVFVDANREWEDAKRICSDIRETALGAIAAQIAFPPPPHPDAQAIVVFNPLGWARSEIIELFVPQTETVKHWGVYDLHGHEIHDQNYYAYRHNSKLDGHSIAFLADQIPAIGYRCFWLCPTEAEPKKLTVQQPEYILENEFLRVSVDPNTGDLASIFDKQHQREILSHPGNQLQAFRDEGQYWDAWNIDPDYAQHPLPPAKLLDISRDRDDLGSHHIHPDGKLFESRIRVTRQIGQSIFNQVYRLKHNSPALEITTTVDWQERHVVVKAAFPLTVSADQATYEIACGAITRKGNCEANERTTTPKTAQEKAQWEVSALGWADLSDKNYGVSLLSDCKHGYDCQPNQIRLTLLRGSEFPDPEADLGYHQFTYAIYPHAGDWQSAQTVRKSHELKQPLHAVRLDPNPEGTLPPVASLLDLQSENLMLTALKQSEDNPNVWILRCYECHGKPTDLKLKSDLGLTIGSAKPLITHSVDLLERPNPRSATSATQSADTQIQPWQIRTFALNMSP
ncbi:MAG: alpha-mannosidase [Myxacorys chilensis ATA2-1-KO14]|jgi:alpha-mannosidase|nr:alpha-mannosidase [Myxacorys chilensis ATA2-1-KO14]